MSDILSVAHINKSFPGFSISDISFALPAGYIMGFIGPNGAGKTTTIKLILNMLHPQSGSITVFGEDHRCGEAAIKERVGVVMDLPYYVDLWRLGEVELALAPFYTTWRSDHYANWLKEFDLPRDKRVKDLSRGMKVKLMLAVALSHEAQLLILDEPTSGLDPVARDELMEVLTAFIVDGDVGSERGILFSTHITADLERVADFITFIRGGRIVYTGTKDDLLETYAVVKGGLNDLLPEQKGFLIGSRSHSAGFDALVRRDDINVLPRDLLIERASLDEIIIYMNAGKHTVPEGI